MNRQLHNNLTWKWSKDRKKLVVSLVLNMEELSLALMRTAGLPDAKDLLNTTSVFLTKREKEVLPLLTQGLSAKEVGSALNISERTVKSHASALYKKFEVQGKLGLMRYMTGMAKAQ